MRTEDLDYYLPPELVAQHPCPVRSDCRLLVLNRSNDEFTDSEFNCIGEFLLPGDCLVLNDTKVLPARFFARRGSGAKLEGLFLAESQTGVWEVMLKGARKIKAGESIYIEDRKKGSQSRYRAEVLSRPEQGMCRLKIDTDVDFQTILEEIGFPPLPPYIKRDDDLSVAAIDKMRYQTVYANRPGAVAAPTAGLHFTSELIEQLKTRGVRLAYITLHIGMGTFKPITAENIEEHEIHPEWFSIDEKNAGTINTTKNEGGRIIAVGTTSVRTLETVAIDSQIKAGSGTTKLFIRPGYKFKIVDAMVTNFHLPKSTLLALVAAFAGLERILAAYKHAIERRYRFYSYGDAMLIV